MISEPAYYRVPPRWASPTKDATGLTTIYNALCRLCQERYEEHIDGRGGSFCPIVSGRLHPPEGQEFIFHEPELWRPFVERAIQYCIERALPNNKLILERAMKRQDLINRVCSDFD